MKTWIVTITYRVDAETEEDAITHVNDVLEECDSDPIANMRWVETSADVEQEGP